MAAKKSKKNGYMKALQINQIGQQLKEKQVPIPKISNDEVLIRIKAAGICHSDAHYLDGTATVPNLPLTPGHEISGLVERVGKDVKKVKKQDRVALHYLLTCGSCHNCAKGSEQFCETGAMIGKHTNGGYAQYIKVPARNAIKLPEEVSYAEGAALMCSASTTLHAMIKSEFKPGESIAIYGAGGLGMSAIQIAKAFGASDIYAVDINKEKLKLAKQYGAIPIDASKHDPVSEILKQCNGVDVAMELIGLPKTMQQSVKSLATFGRAVIVGIGNKPLELLPYSDILLKEAKIIGSADHLLQEMPLLMDLAKNKKIDLSNCITKKIPLDKKLVNQTLEDLINFKSDVRTIIEP